MSQQFMENKFPLAARKDANAIKSAIGDNLYSENPDPMVPDDSPEAVFYVRSDYEGVMHTLKDQGIKLAGGEASQLIDFASEYASLVDQESDMEELRVAQEREAQNAQFVEEKAFILENWRDRNGAQLPDEVAEAAARTLLSLRRKMAKSAIEMNQLAFTTHGFEVLPSTASLNQARETEFEERCAAIDDLYNDWVMQDYKTGDEKTGMFFEEGFVLAVGTYESEFNVTLSVEERERIRSFIQASWDEVKEHGFEESIEDVESSTSKHLTTDDKEKNDE